MQQNVHSLSLSHTNAADSAGEGRCKLSELQRRGNGYLKHGHQHLRRLQHQATAGFLIGYNSLENNTIDDQTVNMLPPIFVHDQLIYSLATVKMTTL